MSENIKLESVKSTLKSKIGSVHALRSIFTPVRVQAAQKIIENAKAGYFDDIDELMEIFQTASTKDVKPKEIYEATKSLKAQAEGLGFIFLMELSDGFYKFLQEKVDIYSATPKTKFDKGEKMVVKKYAEAITMALKNRERGKGGMVEANILNSLELLKNRYSKPAS